MTDFKPLTKEHLNHVSEKEFLSDDVTKKTSINREEIDNNSSYQLEKDFNSFIHEWCNKDYPHLIDSDDNDGEFFRQELRKYIHKKNVHSAVRGLLQERELAQLNNDIFRKSVDEVQDDWIDAVNKWFKGVIK